MVRMFLDRQTDESIECTGRYIGKRKKCDVVAWDVGIAAQSQISLAFCGKSKVRIWSGCHEIPILTSRGHVSSANGLSEEKT